MNTWKPCGRLGRHLSHHWQGQNEWNPDKHRWERRTYFCIGRVITEGGNRVVD